VLNGIVALAATREEIPLSEVKRWGLGNTKPHSQASKAKGKGKGKHIVVFHLNSVHTDMPLAIELTPTLSPEPSGSRVLRSSRKRPIVSPSNSDDDADWSPPPPEKAFSSMFTVEVANSLITTTTLLPYSFT
jgi:hypothetical protein